MTPTIKSDCRITANSQDVKSPHSEQLVLVELSQKIPAKSEVRNCMKREEQIQRQVFDLVVAEISGN